MEITNPFREIQYPHRLANVLLVNKVNVKWRMYVNFIDLNNTCPKDSYSFPSIDTLVNDALGCELLSFMDGFLGYNEIRMHPMDEEKTSFMG